MMHEAHLYVKHVRCLYDLKRDVVLMAGLVPRLFLVGRMRKGGSMEFLDSCRVGRKVRVQSHSSLLVAGVTEISGGKVATWYSLCMSKIFSALIHCALGPMGADNLRFIRDLSSAKVSQLCLVTSIPLGVDDPDSCYHSHS